MTTEPIAFIPPLREVDASASAVAILAPRGGDFANWLAQALGRVNADLALADQGMQSLATGEAQNLHQVMIALEEARMGVQVLVQVRNRLLDAYQEVLRMQV